MKRIILSLGAIVFVGALVAGATGAFFSDTETSTGNTFSAGSLDLKIDSESHYNGLICRLDANNEYRWLEPVDGEIPDPTPQNYNQPCDGTWVETDLGPEHKFFNLDDVKPGDNGEVTISMHVYDNDAWGRFVISDVLDLDNDCTEPEGETELAGENATPGCSDPEGELAESVTFQGWIDDGDIPGFQGKENDSTEGDNLKQEREELVIFPGTVDEGGETHNIWQALSQYRTLLDNSGICEATDPDGNGQTDNDGDPSQDDYEICQGIADDGRLVGSTTYYFALAWDILEGVGNEAQTDSLDANLTFQIEQHRNNSNPFISPSPTVSP